MMKLGTALGLALVLLAGSPAVSRAEIVTIVLVNHRASGTNVIRFLRSPCNMDGETRGGDVTDSATYRCDLTFGDESPYHSRNLLSIGTTHGVEMCEVVYYSQPWIDGLGGQSEAYDRAHTRPPGITIDQHHGDGKRDQTRPGCALSQTGPNAYQVDTTVMLGWMGNEY